jgi:DNA-binding NtrC family response regulator
MATRVLIIDDDRDTADFLKLLVEPRGDLARTASDAAQAREILRSWRPEVALMDLMLPDADGIDLLKDFKEASPETQVIMVTGYGSVPKAVEAMKAGAFAIEKTRTPTLLVMLDRPRKTTLGRTNGSKKSCAITPASPTSRAATRWQLFPHQVGRADRRERVDSRRERHGERARGQRHSLAQQA